MIMNLFDKKNYDSYLDFLMGGSNTNHLDTINDTGFIAKKMRGGFKNNSRKRRMKKEGAF